MQLAMQSSHVLIVTFLISLTLLVGSSTSTEPTTDLIKASCSVTLYPKLCMQSLSGCVNPIQQISPRLLAQKARSMSLGQARSASAVVSKLALGATGINSRDVAAVKDCIDNIADSTDMLKRSIRELDQVGQPGSQNFKFQMSNVQTWVNTALTDQTTCTDGLSVAGISSNVEGSIGGRIVIESQLTSLVNRFASCSAYIGCVW